MTLGVSSSLARACFSSSLRRVSSSFLRSMSLLAEDFVDLDLQLVVVDGFLQVAEGAQLEGLDGVLHAAVAGDQDHQRLLVVGADLLQGRNAVHDRHLDIHQHKVGGLRLVDLHGGPAVGGLEGLVIVHGEQAAELLAQQLLVVGDEDARPGGGIRRVGGLLAHAFGASGLNGSGACAGSRSGPAFAGNRPFRSPRCITACRR
ncbi:MAG: hypothetical protein HQL31_13740 [Planctomycetes bacterium]|nr:hypothetical protein [Planctomycetota bacterium]